MNVVPHAIKKVHNPIKAGAREGGSLKFGVTPGGGMPAGVLERSVPGGNWDAMTTTQGY